VGLVVKKSKRISVRFNTGADFYVGSRVRSRRHELGMSQAKLAEGVGLTFQQIQKYEKGTNRIGASRLQQFANILGVPISFFFEGMEGTSPVGKRTALDPAIARASNFIASSDGLSLAKAFMKIKDSKFRHRIAVFVEQVANRQED
jgi:transcriptional regulator with XRE-family HTH domain